MVACERGLLSIVELLLLKGVDPNAVDQVTLFASLWITVILDSLIYSQRGMTAAMWIFLSQYVVDNHMKILEVLLKKETDLNITDTVSLWYVKTVGSLNWLECIL